ncbi:hypothetical protein JCM10213_001071 [Rhodosporidiobolus nylandii]
MAAKDDAAPRTVLAPLALSSVLSSPSLPSSGVYRGRVVSTREYSPHTKLASVTLAPAEEDATPDARLEVELKGWWADKAARRFRPGEVVVLRTAGATLLEGSAKGKEKPGAKRRLRYEKGLTGWAVRKGGQEEVLRYKARSAPLASPPSSSRPSLPFATSLAAIPAKRPLPTSSSSPDPSPVPPKASAPGEGARSIKRRKQEERLGWGITTASDTTYIGLDKLGDVLHNASRAGSAATKKLVNVLAAVSDAGELCAPRRADGDWYRRILLVCPSQPNKPVELQWYAKAAVAVPSAAHGQLLAVHGLTVKGSPSSPSLVAGSFDPTPHALVSSKHLLTPSGPTQHPDPAPPLPACPTSVNAWTWRKQQSLAKAYGIALDEEELKYAARVARFFRREGGNPLASVSPGVAEADGPVEATSVAEKVERAPTSLWRGGRPLLRVEEIEDGKFCDLVGMVTNLSTHSPYAVGSLPSNHYADLFVTDYTSHPLLKSYDAPSAASAGVGLEGQLTLRVSLFGYQVEPLLPYLKPQEKGGIKRGTLVHLRNLRVKEGVYGHLEATLVEEKEERYRWKRDVTVLEDGKGMDEAWKAAAKGVLRRHRDYWAAQSGKGQAK